MPVSDTIAVSRTTSFTQVYFAVERSIVLRGYIFNFYAQSTTKVIYKLDYCGALNFKQCDM